MCGVNELMDSHLPSEAQCRRLPETFRGPMGNCCSVPENYACACFGRRGHWAELVNPEHWRHPGLGLETGKSCSQEPRSGRSGAHESRVGHAPRSDACAGTMHPWLGAQWPDGATIPMIVCHDGACVLVLRAAVGLHGLYLLGTGDKFSELVEPF